MVADAGYIHDSGEAEELEALEGLGHEGYADRYTGIQFQIWFEINCFLTAKTFNTKKV